jgi:hypothetical protein
VHAHRLLLCGVRTVQLICPSCQSPCLLLAAFSRFFDMPMRCQSWTYHFDVPRVCAMGLTLPEADDHFPAGHTTSEHHPSAHHIGGSAFDRSVSARRNHHSITCTHCRRSLLLAGKDRPPHPVRLTCPACLHCFTHDPVHRLIWRDAALTAVFAVVIFALSVFALDHYQLISLAQLEAWQWLADIAARIAAALGWAGPD